MLAQRLQYGSIIAFQCLRPLMRILWAMLLTWVAAELMAIIAQRELYLTMQVAKCKAAKEGIRALTGWLEGQGGAVGKLATGLQSVAAAASLWGEGGDWAKQIIQNPGPTTQDMESWHTTVNGVVMTVVAMILKWGGQNEGR